LTTSKLPGKLAVDASPILLAVIGGSALKGFWDARISLYTTASTLREVLEYAPRLAEKADIPLQEALASLSLLPLTVYGRSFYKSKLPEAHELIGKRDPDDVDLLALALKLNLPVWTNDKDFENTGVPIYTTARLFSLSSEPR